MLACIRELRISAAVARSCSARSRVFWILVLGSSHSFERICTFLVEFGVVSDRSYRWSASALMTCSRFAKSCDTSSKESDFRHRSGFFYPLRLPDDGQSAGELWPFDEAPFCQQRGLVLFLDIPVLFRPPSEYCLFWFRYVRGMWNIFYFDSSLFSRSPSARQYGRPSVPIVGRGWALHIWSG